MTREKSWQATGGTLKLLRQMTEMGWNVSVFRLQSSLFGTMKAGVEMYAIAPRTDPPRINMVRVAVGEAPDIDYRCACELARMCGIHLEC